DFDGRDEKDDLGRTVKKKDFARALDAYARALAAGVVPADRLRVTARLALSLEELKRFEEAAQVWDRLIKENPDATGESPETWLVGRGRARLRAGHAPE